VFHKFKTPWVWGGLVAAIACAATIAPVAQAATTTGNVSGWVKNAIKVGTASSSQSVEIAVHLSLTNTAALKQLATNVSSPTSKTYGRYLTAEEFGARFAPNAADVNTVKALLEHAGMSNVEVGPHGVYVSATATVSQISSTFKVTQNTYSYQGKTLRANKEEATIPAALAGKIVYIEGLDDTMALRTPFHISASQGDLVAPATAHAPDAATLDAAAKATGTAVTPPPVAAGIPSPYCNKYFGSTAIVATLSTAADVYGAKIPWLNCGYTPAQIRAAYGINKVNQWTGSGVTVAIVDAYASPTLLSDTNRYSANHGLPILTAGQNFSQIIPIGIYNVSPSEVCDPYGWWGEQSLDMAAVHSTAPGANIVYVGSRDCMTSLDIAFVNTVYNHVADVVTDSWGNNGESIAPGTQTLYDQAAMAGAAQGVTVLFSSGDDGDLAALNGVASGSWPATSAWVTGVGGTTLELMDSSGAKAEYGWGTYRAFLADAMVKSAHSVITSGLAQTTNDFGTFDDFVYYSGSGGGISLLEAQPTYQAKEVPYYLATTLNLASGFTTPLPNPQRVSPDVAMDADPYTGFLVGETYTIAGTIADQGCAPISKTEEYCEIAYGGTSVASPLMAGVFAVMNQRRTAHGEPLVGFANPLLYSIGSRGNGTNFTSAAINQIVAPAEAVSVLRGYASDLTEIRVVTINSVASLINETPYPFLVCGLPVCLGLNEEFNYTSESPATSPPTPAGYNDVTGLGVPWVPKLILEE
jgi:subtilase family serine protease